jgi:hypothetical protein
VNQLAKLGNQCLTYSLPVAILGAFFRLMHFNGANYMLTVGLSSVALGALLKYWSEKTLEGFLTGAGIATVCMAVLFKLMHW